MFPIRVAVSFWFYVLAWCSPTIATEPRVTSFANKFRKYSGAELVFRRDDLPEGRYHDILKPLDQTRRVRASEICLGEAKLYPPGFLSQIGLKSIGVFDACVSKTTNDRSRPFDAGLGGYRYYGIYNGRDAIATAFYSDGQLALTFHHEVFHHVDSTVDGETEKWQLSADDALYRAAISGLRPYAPPPIAAHDLAALRGRRIGITLQDSVSAYAAKNPREDQAETARHMMSMLPSSIVQAIEQPDLPGSQRIIHVIGEYQRACVDGPGMDWFVDVALDRAHRDRVWQSGAAAIAELQLCLANSDKNPEGARHAIGKLVRHDPAIMSPVQRRQAVKLAAEITRSLMAQRLSPDDTETRFNIWGSEDANGVNLTLRHDIVTFANDAKRLSLIAAKYVTNDPQSGEPQSGEPQSGDSQGTETEVVNEAITYQLRILGRYQDFVKSGFSITPGSQAVFTSSQRAIASLLAK